MEYLNFNGLRISSPFSIVRDCNIAQLNDLSIGFE